MVNLIGQTLGQYRIIEQIGQGGMATVYKAYQPSLDRYVAAKVLPPYFAHEPGFAMRFTREAKAIARLNHPNILPIYDFGQEGDLSYIVMKYVEAGTLKDIMGRPLPLDLTANVLRQIAGALEHAHERGILHRDVKPSNVLLDEGHWVLLTDFGLAKMVEGSAVLTASGVGVGTPAYMAPEQGQGEPVDARADIYSLGVVLYEMLTGRVPFEAETPMAVVIKHITDPLPLPRTINPELPETIERIILKALAKKPGDRFARPMEMADALSAAVAGFATPVPDTVEFPAERPQPAPPPPISEPEKSPAEPPELEPEPEPIKAPPEEPAPIPTPLPEETPTPTRKPFPWKVLGGIAAVVALALAAIFGLSSLGGDETKETPTAAAAATATPHPKPTATERATLPAEPTLPPVALPDTLFQKVYFKADFEGEAAFQSLPDGWAIEDDDTGNHVLMGKPPNPLWVPGSSGRTVFVLEADVRLVEGEEAYILTRYNPSSNDGIGLVCGRDRWEMVQVPGMEAMDVHSGTDNVSGWQHLRLVLLENRLLAFLNDTLIFDQQIEPASGGVGLAVHENSKFYVDNVRITGPSQASLAEGWELYDDFNDGSLNEARWEWQPALEGDTAWVDSSGRLIIEARNPEAEERYGKLVARTNRPFVEIQADLIIKELKGEFTDLFLYLSAEGGRMAGFIGESGHVAAFEEEGGLRILRENQGIPAELHLHLTLTEDGRMEVIANGEPVGEIPAAPVANGFAIGYRLDPDGSLVGLVDNVQVMFLAEADVPHEPELVFECPDDLGCVGIPAGEPLLIAHLLDQSGPTQNLSRDILRGTELAIKDQGDILGHPIELAGFDSGCALLAARRAAEQIVQNADVVAIVGTTCSISAGAAAPIITKAGLVMVSPANTQPQLTDPQMHQAGYLRVAPNDKTQGALAAEFARSDALGAATVAILYEENGYSEFLALTFGGSFKDLGGEILIQEPINMENQEDLRRILELVAEAQPDLVFYPLFVEAGAAVTAMIRETPGLESTALMGANGMFDPQLLELAGPAAEGLYLVSPDYAARGDRYERFLARFREMFGEQPQSLFHAYGYDAAALILKAIERVAVQQGDVLVVPRQALREALFATHGFEGLTGTLTCSPTGDCAESKASVYQIVSPDPESWNPPGENPRQVWP